MIRIDAAQARKTPPGGPSAAEKRRSRARHRRRFPAFLLRSQMVGGMVGNVPQPTIGLVTSAKQINGLAHAFSFRGRDALMRRNR
jgi:hypothetical protein